VVETPARAWQQAVGQILAHQLHRYLCRAVLDQDPRAADYTGSRAAGIFLHDVMALGRTRDGLVVLRQATGEELSAAALLDYYAPLMTWLEAENTGRDVGF
jgi:peptidyl-dipeptidase A